MTDLSRNRRKSKKLMHQSLDSGVSSSNSTVSRISRYPEAKSPLRREIHAPSRVVKFGFSVCSSQKPREFDVRSTTRRDFCDEMGSLWSCKYDKAKQWAFDALRCFRKDKDVIDVDDDSSDEVEILENGRDERWRVFESVPEMEVKMVGTDSSNVNVRVDAATESLSSLSLKLQVVDVWRVEAGRKLLESAVKQACRLKELGLWIVLNIWRQDLLRDLDPLRAHVAKPVKELPHEPFIPLSKEQEFEIERAFSAESWQVLVTHENSNIDITGKVLQCLMPGAWLSDEAINLYLELLKERETREPHEFLKCHFFNTFFYKKLASADAGYSHKAVRRWTSVKKLGYHLIECDKIFVPIHQEIHWCLAVINKTEQKFQYLDSLKGKDRRVLDILATYFVDEVKDKNGEDIDVSSWEREFIENIPEQKNGFDCGMFMLKYIDFYSRGSELCFGQEHMPYFRRRTAKEILRLRAD